MKCFVIMPFGDPQKEPERASKLELTYSDCIKPTVESIKIPGEPDESISCHRADMASRPGEIITHVIENLVSADIVIADLSGRNPNVFYELGVRHAVNNNTILIADSLDAIPFDLRGLRTIIYKWDAEHMLKLQKSLKNAINEILEESDKIDNPVRRYLYNRETEKLVKEPSPPGYDVVKSILNEMSSLRKAFTEQASEIRNIVSQITVGKDDNLNNVNKSGYNIEFFKGVWEDESDGSILYAQVIDNELFMPYLYENDPDCPAHYFNCKLIGNTLFARFEWAEERDISGYAFFNIESEDMLIGGWWYDRNVPQEIRNNIALISKTIPGMESMAWKRVKEKKIEPKWIQEYFKKAKSKGNIDGI